MAGRGGARPGAGRPRGPKSPAALARDRALRRFETRILRELSPLMRAQLDLAYGTTGMFERADGKWRRVSSLARVEALLNDESQENGKDYYYIAAKDPDGRMLDSLMNRVFGKPKESVELTGKDDGPVLVRFVDVDAAA